MSRGCFPDNPAREVTYSLQSERPPDAGKYITRRVLLPLIRTPAVPFSPILPAPVLPLLPPPLPLPHNAGMAILGMLKSIIQGKQIPGSPGIDCVAASEGYYGINGDKKTTS